MRRYARAAARFGLTLAVLTSALGLSVTAPGHVRSVARAAVDPVIAAAGDIGCDPSDANYNAGAGASSFCQQQATAALLDAGYSAILPLGDEQYTDGTLAKFQQVYDPSWGRTKALHRPVPGNHEYLTSGAAGYFDYYGAQAGTRGQGWYSYDLGAWHLIALNGECSYVGGCGAGTPQESWLKADLAAHPTQCTLAYWHEPKFTSTDPGNTAPFQAFWTDLRAAGADVVLNGHQHNYERFAPQTENGVADPDGIREFVVGTGGKGLVGFASPIASNSEVRNSSTYGVLQLTLHAGSYDWQFVPEAGGTFTDSGSGSCRPPVASASPTPTTSPPPPSQPPPSPPTSPSPDPSVSPSATSGQAPSPTTASTVSSSTNPSPPATVEPTASPTGSPSAPPGSPPAGTAASPSPTGSSAPPPTTTPAGCDPVIRSSASEVRTGQAVSLDVSGLVPGRSVSLEGYARPSSTYAALRAPTRPAADGTLRFTVFPTTNTRLRVQVEDCPQPGTSQVLVAHAALTLSVTREGPRLYTFTGRILPGRPNVGRNVGLYYRTSTATIRKAVASVAADGTYRVTVQFGSGGQLGFLFQTGSNTVNAAATSPVRTVLVA